MTGTLTNQETTAAGRKELETLLGSEIFRRAPTLARILEYLCERQMEGETFIKEYEIATRVMGRPSSFDPQLDGSVRVNLHHLRKKLKTYYQTEGIGHAIHITLPVGQNLPSFVVQDISSTEEPTVEAPQEPAPSLSPVGEEPVASPGSSPQTRPPLYLWLLVAFLLATTIATAAWALHLKAGANGRAMPIINDAAVRIACGRTTPLVDEAGRTWSSDAYSTGGSRFERPLTLSMNGGPADLYKTGREGTFSYDIPLPLGTYELHLYFAESAVHGEGFRAMNVYLNGKRVNQMLDITSDSGGFATPLEKVYGGVQPAADGKLHIAFKGVTGKAFVNGLEIMAGNGTRMRTLRQSTLSTYYFDPSGRVWFPDAWYQGGRTSRLQDVFPGLAVDGLYRNERFGNFIYSLPVIAGHTYGITLYFQEVWFSRQNKGRRRFSVSCNGKELLHDFDILGQAPPGTARATVHFDGLEASSQGKLLLSFSPTQNYASVNAIEVEDQTPGTTGSESAPVVNLQLPAATPSRADAP